MKGVTDNSGNQKKDAAMSTEYEHLSREALIELLNDKIRCVEGVASTETFVYLQLKKQKYDWGTR